MLSHYNSSICVLSTAKSCSSPIGSSKSTACESRTTPTSYGCTVTEQLPKINLLT